jgi:hypothetical protein
VKKKAGNNSWKLVDLKLIQGNKVTYGRPCTTRTIRRRFPARNKARCGLCIKATYSLDVNRLPLHKHSICYPSLREVLNKIAFFGPSSLWYVSGAGQKTSDYFFNKNFIMAAHITIS